MKLNYLNLLLSALVLLSGCTRRGLEVGRALTTQSLSPTPYLEPTTGVGPTRSPNPTLTQNPISTPNPPATSPSTPPPIAADGTIIATDGNRFTLGVIPGEVYRLTVIPSVDGSGSYTAQPISGAARVFGAPVTFASVERPWSVDFEADTSVVTLSLTHTNNATTFSRSSFGKKTLYGRKVRDFNALAKKAYLAGPDGGNWYFKSMFDAIGRPIWAQAHVMAALPYLYELTGDKYWIAELVRHADRILEQTDESRQWKDFQGKTSPAWGEDAQEESDGTLTPTRYSWLAVAAAFMRGPVYGAVLIANNRSLHGELAADGKTLRAKATSYVDHAKRILDHFQSNQRISGEYTFYRFPDELPLRLQSLRNQPQPTNMHALTSMLHAGLFQYHRITASFGATVPFYASSAGMARYLRSALSRESDRYVWKYSVYSSRADDIGHAMFTAESIVRLARAGIVFGQEDLSRLSRTFDSLIDSTGALTHDLIDGTNGPTPIFRTAYYWLPVISFTPGLREKAIKYTVVNHERFLDLVGMGIGDHLR